MQDSNSRSTSTVPGESLFDRTCLMLWAMLCVGLFAATWRLWLPGFTAFPRVPVLLEPSAPLLWIHFIATTAVIASLVEIAVRNRAEDLFLVLLITGMTILFVCNLHCLQAWAWQILIFAVLLWGLPRAEAKKWMGFVMISIYLFSAISKFDFQFLHTTGKELLEAGCSLFGLPLDPGMDSRWQVAMFPIGELAIGLGLIFAPTRKLAIVAAVLMHVCLIVLLWELGHKPAVMIWNAIQILLVVWLFWNRLRRVEAGNRSVKADLARCFAIAVLFLPWLRPVGLCDHWMAWGLYSPSNSRAKLSLPPHHVERLPEELQLHCPLAEPTQTTEFNLGNWSLAELNAPIYPESRFQVTAARELIRKYPQIDWQLTELGPSHPFSGRRSKKVVPDQAAVN